MTGLCSGQQDMPNNWEDSSCSAKRFVRVGSVRYGLRLGAVSPPPPGAGPRYRSQCCWPTTTAPVSRIPPTINSNDIFSCVNRVRMAATSETLEQPLNTVTKLLFKNRRLCDCDTLDRLPRFRFGGNRDRERDKTRPGTSASGSGDQRLKELTERIKQRGPVPPPRVKHSTPPAAPFRSASFSQVDYSTTDNKYVRRRNTQANEELATSAFTLPRPKPHASTLQTPDTNNVNHFYEMLYQGNKEDNLIMQSLDEVTSELQTASANNTPIMDNPPNRTQDKKRDKSRRRKGMYISQWPNTYQRGEEVLNQFTVTPDDWQREAEQTSANERQTKELPSTTEIPTLKISSDNRNNFETWTSPQEEPLSAEDNTILEWPICETNVRQTRPTLSAQNSEEQVEPSPSTSSTRFNYLARADSLSEGEPEQGEKRTEQLFVPSDVSDCESRASIGNDACSPHVPRRYSKRPLRGPYGQMLEAEMKKPETGRKHQFNSDLKFLEDLSTIGVGDPKPKSVQRSRTNPSNYSLDESQLKHNLSPPSFKQGNSNKRKVSVDSPSQTSLPGGGGVDGEQKLIISHQRTTSSPSKLEAFSPKPEASPELLEQLLRGSSEQLATSETNLTQRCNDTRTHVVVELYETELSYVEALQTLVTKYLEPLKSQENCGLLDGTLVDEIFYQIPALYGHHQLFLDELKKRLEHWDLKQKVGDVFLDVFSKPAVIETYTSYVNNWKRAREIIKTAQQSKPAFARFLEATAREHKGKLALDSLLIKPIQKFPKYELLIQRLLKHTDSAHPDHGLLLAAQREVHDQLLKINCTEREALELEQLRELESLVEGLIDLVATDRQYLRHDLVSMTAGSGARKERALFLFSDLLLVTSIKRRSGTIRRQTSGQGSVTSTLDANKYKLLMRIALDDLDIVKAKDENLRQMMLEIENLSEDIAVLNQINELAWSLHCTHGPLDEVIREMLSNLNKQLNEQQNSDSQLSCLELNLNTANGQENLSVVFSKPEKRGSWEESFNEAKHKLAISGDRRPCPELVAPVPIRKTRAGLQFTCAAPTLGDGVRDVWVCNSDGYVGQVCVLSLQPEPTVTSCNGVCNARILCVASVPAANYSRSLTNKCINTTRDEVDDHCAIQFDSSSSSDEEEHSDDEPTDSTRISNTATIRSAETASTDSDDADSHQSTMWLGTEDGCIYVYNSSDNIRIKKNKIRLQLGSSILCIIYLDNRVFVSLANGDITIYDRDLVGSWNTTSPLTISVSSTSMPALKMLPNFGKIWCGCGNTIKIFNCQTLETDHNFSVSADTTKPITCMVISGHGVWLSLQNSAVVKCFHSLTFEPLCEVNVASAVTKMLTSCDDIIRQHKAACLRVTSLLACKDLLWVGTSAGVLLTMPLPHITATTTKLSTLPNVAGVPHGHTGHVRFLTYVESPILNSESSSQRLSYKGKSEQRGSGAKLLVISGGDGYEDFRSSNLSEVAGREDSTNHLLLWHV